MGCVSSADGGMGLFFGPTVIATTITGYFSISALVVGIATWALKTLAESFVSANTSATLGKVSRVSAAISLVAFLAIPVVGIVSFTLTLLRIGCLECMATKNAQSED